MSRSTLARAFASRSRSEYTGVVRIGPKPTNERVPVTNEPWIARWFASVYQNAGLSIVVTTRALRPRRSPTGSAVPFS